MRYGNMFASLKNHKNNADAIFKKMDTDFDGKVSEKDFIDTLVDYFKENGYNLTKNDKKSMKRDFAKMDEDHDGFVSVEDLAK